MLEVFRAARVWPSVATGIIDDGVVVVENGHITQVGSWDDLAGAFSSTDVRVLGDVTLMPGLFDCHVHLQLDPSGVSAHSYVERSEEEFHSLIKRNASLLLDAGVTTARDLGSSGQVLIQTRDAINKGDFPGPRLQCANAPLTVPGGHCHGMGGVCSGVEGVRAEVRKRAAEGADVIKVMSTGGFMTAGSRPSEARFSPEEMSAIKSEALKFNIPVTTHATGTQGIQRAADAGFDSIEHCSWIDHDGKARFDRTVAEQLIKKGIAVCPTMNTACTSHSYFCPWDEREAVVGNLRKMREAGVWLVAGTDAGIGLCRFERYADGLGALVDAGYTALEIAVMATESAAKLCGLENETGQLVPGFCADLAAFYGNPLDNIEDFAMPSFVMAQGREHCLKPIAPLGNIKEQADETFKLLRSGAGLDR